MNVERRPADVGWVLAVFVILAAIGTTVAVAASGTAGSPVPALPRAQSAQTVVSTAGEVAPLKRIAAPDALLIARHGLTRSLVHRVRHRVGVRSLIVVDAGRVHIDGRRPRILAVNPSRFRSFTPPPTAASDVLWRALADGDLVVDYRFARERHLGLGSNLRVQGVVMHVGAFAALGIPRVGAVVSRAVAPSLGLQHGGRGNAVVVSAPGRTTTEIRDAAEGVLGSGTRVIATHPPTSSDDGRPDTYLELYQAAARTCPGLSWTVLAAIGQVESGHGVNVGPSSAGALGPMQFLPSTWQAYGVDGDGDGVANIMDPFDAVYAAARYLCLDGAGRGGASLRRAVFLYNHAWWYVREVLGLARLYG